MRKMLAGKSEQERREFFRERMKSRQGEMQNEIAEFFGLSAKQRVAFLDKKINESEKRRKERAKSRKTPTNGQTRERQGDWGKGKTPEEISAARDSMRRRMLDNTTPELRAQMSEFREVMNARREQRGLPPITRRGRG